MKTERQRKMKSYALMNDKDTTRYSEMYTTKVTGPIKEGRVTRMKTNVGYTVSLHACERQKECICV